MEKYVKIFVAASIFLALIAQLSEFRGDIINVLTPTAKLAAFIGILYVSIYSKKLYPKFFPALILLTSAQFFSFLGDLTWTIIESILRQNPYPSIADLFYLLYYPLFAAGIFLIPIKRRVERIRTAVDLSIIGVSTLTLLWIFILKPIIFSGGEFTEVFISTLYVIGDVLVLFMVLELAVNKMGFIRSKTLNLFMISIAVLLLADIIFTYTTTIGIDPAGTILDIWWMVSYLILVLATVEFYREDWSRPLYSPRKRRIITYLPEIFVLLFYILTTIAIFEVGGFTLNRIEFAEEVIVAYGLIILLFTGRQRLSIKENAELLEEVESEKKTAEMYLDVAGSLIMVLDERDRVKLINTRGLEILEGERDEIIGKNWFLTFVPPEDRERRLKLYRDHRKRNDGYHLEGDILTLKGRRRTVSWNVRFLRENNEFMGSIIAGEDITEVKKAREELEISEKRYRSIFEGAPVPIISLDPDGRVRDCNSAAERVLEYSTAELQGMDIKDLVHPDDRKREIDGPIRLMSRSGRLIYANIRVRSMGDEEIVIIEDQTEIMESLREKELLLREIHHRVKNNLQIISSLLSIQERQIESRKLRNILAESRDRIRSIALVHEHLYHSTDLSTVRIRGYLENLISKITQGQTASGGPRIHTSIEDLEFNLETSLPVGLIVNELVSNSLKHAEASNIYVELKGLNGEFELRVADDGRGVESPDVITGSRSMGWYLIRALIDQLDGEMDIETDGGLSIRIRFHELSYEKRY